MLDVTESEQDVCVLARREHNWFRCVGKLERHVRQFIDPAVTITIPPSGSRKRTLRDFGCCSTGLKLGNKLKATRTTTRDEGEKSEGNSDSQQNEKCKNALRSRCPIWCPFAHAVVCRGIAHCHP